MSYVEGAVDVFVQLERRNGNRWVSQIQWKGADSAGPNIRADLGVVQSALSQQRA